MRQERTIQATIFEVFAGHQIGGELKAISRWLGAGKSVRISDPGRQSIAVAAAGRSGQSARASGELC
jgi:IS5 family transposase